MEGERRDMLHRINDLLVWHILLFSFSLNNHEEGEPHTADRCKGYQHAKVQADCGRSSAGSVRYTR